MEILFRFSSLRQVGWTGGPQEIILENARRDQLTGVCWYSPVFFQNLIVVLTHARLLQKLTIFEFCGIDDRSPTPSGAVDLDCLHMYTLQVQIRCGRISPTCLAPLAGRDKSLLFRELASFQKSGHEFPRFFFFFAFLGVVKGLESHLQAY